MDYKNNKKGFTLMELLVTVVLVAVLASYSVYYYNNVIDEGKLNAAKGKMAALGGAFERYKLESNVNFTCSTDVAITSLPSCASISGQANDPRNVFCGYAERQLAFDDNFTFYIGCPNDGKCGAGDVTEVTVYMLPKASSSVYPICAYFNPAKDKVSEVKA